MEIYKHIVPIRNFPFMIECTYAYDDNFLVGTKEGHLFVYQIDTKTKSNNDYDIKVKMLCFQKNLFRKSVVQIYVITELRILLCLSENLITVHNLDKPQFPIISTLNKTKGASFFAVDVARIRTLTGEIQYTVRLCVVVKNQLLFFYWKKDNFYELRSNIKLPDVAKSLVWLGSFLYAAVRHQYIKVNCDSGTYEELFLTSTDTLMTSLAGNSSGNVNFIGTEPMSSTSFATTGLALCRDKKTFLFDRNAKPLLDYVITWSDTPVSLTDDSLFLVAILAKDSSIEILTTSAQRIVTIQKITFDIPSPGSLSKPLKSISKWRNRFGQLILHSENDIVLLKAVPNEQQIRILQNEKYFDLALKLIEMDTVEPSREEETSNIKLPSSPIPSHSPPIKNLEDPIEKEKIKNDILNKQALDKFCSGDFKQAINIFQSLNTDPSYVIGLYPDLLSDDFRARLKYPVKLPIFEGAALDQGLMCLIDYLLEIRRKIRDDTSRLEQSKESKELSANLGMTYKDLFNLQSIIDTSLLKCYLQTNESLASSLLRIPDNHCHLEETEKALKKKQKYKELVILYRTKGLHKNALELLEKQAKFNDEQNKSINRRQLVEYLQELGPDHINLIFRYCEWLVKEFPDDGLSVFIDDINIEESTALPREAVLEFLSRNNSALVIPYLEHCIFKWNEQRSKFHDTLINKYREKIRFLMTEYQLEIHQQMIENRMEILDESTDNDNEDKSSDTTSSSDFLPGMVKDYFLRPEPAGQEPNELGDYRRKLMKLLEESNNYNIETLPTYLLHDGLFDERAIVMGKIGNHKEALMIYVHVLQDLQRAEEYCLKQYCRPNATQSSRDVFLILIEQCLKSPNYEQLRLRKCHFGFDNKQSFVSHFAQNFSSKQEKSLEKLFQTLPPKVVVAISILARHSDRIDLQRALELLPTDLPLSAIILVLIQSLEHLNSRRNYLKVLRQLLHSQRLRVHQSRIRIEQSNRLLLTSMDICQACTKKIGKSVFVCYSNRDLVHFGCRDLYEQNRSSIV